MAAGIGIGFQGFLDFAWKAAGRTTEVFMEAHGDDVLLPGSGMAALPVFLLATPTGVLSLYLTASGFLRAVGAFVADDYRGDYLLTLVDRSVQRVWVSSVAARRRAVRERREGPEVPDRLVSGAQVRRPEFDLVLLASRARTGWEVGSYLVGADGAAYRIGVPFDFDSPAGLRTAYPLTPLTTLEPIRHAIPYDLPRQRDGSIPRGEPAEK